jgi:tetratricopeptide (TPR) repeat protein
MRRLARGWALVAMLALANFPAARAQEATRDEIVEQIGALHERLTGQPEDRTTLAKIRALADDFLARFPDDEDAQEVRFYDGEACFRLGDHARAQALFESYLRVGGSPRRRPAAQYLLGLSIAAQGRDADAAAALAEAAALAPPGSAVRFRALLSLGELQEARGEAGAAAEVFGRIVADDAAPAGDRKSAEREIDDLAKIGKPAPPLAELTPTATATVLVFEKGASLDVPPVAARVVRVQAAWGEERLKPWRFPVLPRVYVVDRRGVVRAAGVRGPAIRAAAEAAER